MDWFYHQHHHSYYIMSDPIIIPTKEAYAKQTVDPQKLIINFISEGLYDY